jgi:hypothetical protein
VDAYVLKHGHKEISGNCQSYNSEVFLKAKTNGTVATDIAAEITNANPSNPKEIPKENAVAAKTGAAVCANPAIAHATPNAPPCAFSGVFVEISVFKVTIWIPKPKDNTAATANIIARSGATDKAKSPTVKKAMPSKVRFNRLSFLLSAGNRTAWVNTLTAPIKKKTNPVCKEPNLKTACSQGESVACRKTNETKNRK